MVTAVQVMVKSVMAQLVMPDTINTGTVPDDELIVVQSCPLPLISTYDFKVILLSTYTPGATFMRYGLLTLLSVMAANAAVMVAYCVASGLVFTSRISALFIFANVAIVPATLGKVKVIF